MHLLSTSRAMDCPAQKEENAKRKNLLNFNDSMQMHINVHYTEQNSVSVEHDGRQL